MEVICFGDSITRGYDVPLGYGWVELSKESFPTIQFENHGIDGLSVQGLLNHLEQWQASTVYNPNRYIIIMCGTNDILQGRNSDYVYNKLLQAYDMAATRGRIMIGLETQIDGDMDGLNQVVIDVNERLRAYGAMHDICIIDFYEALHRADAEGHIVFAGEVHPNVEGYHRMAQCAMEALNNTLLG